MTLQTQIATDATTVFLRTDDFAESATYHPYKFRGDALRADRAINAQIIRNGYVELEGGITAPAFEVHVANDTTSGINSDELDLKNDRLTFVPRDGKTAITVTICNLTIQDAGMLVLEAY